MFCGWGVKAGMV